jgi:beta-lactamase regulating signal transducer with metallopeptidase domain
VYLIQYVSQCFHLRSIKKSANFSDQSKWIDLLKKSGIEIPSKLKIGFSQQVNAPIVFGIFEPVILFPVSICTYLSPTQIKMILLHEIAHIKRFDFIIHLALKFIHCILWFNPFVHILHKRIQCEREIACDALVDNTFNDPLNYTKALFLLSQKVYINKINLSLGAYTNQSELLTRIQYLNKIPSSNKIDLRAFILIPLLVLINSFFFKISKNNTNVSKPAILINATAKVNIKSNSIKLATYKKNNKVIVKNVKQSKVYNDQWATNKNLKTTNYNEIIHYNDLLNETKNWVRSLESPVKYVGFDENALKQDSIENAFVERILMSTIIKSYQLKKTLLEQKLEKASNINEASDYLMNSKEWAELQQYQQWVREYLNKQ